MPTELGTLGPVETPKDRAIRHLADTSGLVNPSPSAKTIHWTPSRFNARSDSKDGVLILYNSYTGSFSGFPAKLRDEVEARLHKNGFSGRSEGLTQ
jgi:hypothetical protein